MKPKKSLLDELDAVLQVVDPSRVVPPSSRPPLSAGLASKTRRRRQARTAQRARHNQNRRIKQAAIVGER